MNISELFAKKTDARDKLKSQFWLPKRSKVLIAVSFSDIQMMNFLIPWLAVLPVNFLVFGKENTKFEAKNIKYIDSKDNFDMTWVDALLWSCEDMIIEKEMRLWVVPILNQKNYLGKILSEFEPARWEGNCYLYENDSAWSAYYALVRYIENHNFPYDNRNLVKNVVEV